MIEQIKYVRLDYGFVTHLRLLSSLFLLCSMMLFLLSLHSLLFFYANLPIKLEYLWTIFIEHFYYRNIYGIFFKKIYATR